MQPMQRLATPTPLRILAFVCVAFIAAVSAGPAFAAAGVERSWGAFFGRTHVLFLHLPIGLLLGAFIIEFFGLFRRSRGFDVAAAWLFVLGFLTSIGAVITGLLLGTEQAMLSSPDAKDLTWLTLLFADADQGVSDTLSLHMWLGTTMMVVAGVAAVLKMLAVRKQWKDAESAIPERGGLPLGLARVSLVGVMVAMPFVGHLGGNMTHGPDYLTEKVPDSSLGDTVVAGIDLLNAGTVEKADVPVVVKGDDGVDIELVNGTVAFWNAKIQPVMDVHCTACHNDQKQNGDLRLDSLEWAMKGGSVGGTIEPGEAEFSEIYRRVILPPSHDEFMPTNVKKYGMMSQEDIIVLGEWLTEFDGNLEDSSVTAAPRNEQPELPVEPEPVEPAIDPAALSAINAAGGNAQALSQEENPDQLTVKFAYLKELDPATVAQLQTGADNIAWLSFEGSAFGDAAAKELPALSALTKLNLKDTDITDAGLAELPDMPSLVWLNLFGTAITDAGLDSLKRYDTLDKLYVTGTGVTAEGVAALREALPAAEVFSDHDGQFQFKPVTPDVTPGDPATEKTGNEQAVKPVNAKCPVAGADIKPGFVSTFEGKLVGFCCGGCKGKFDADPSKYKAKLQ
jgi:uncharacterized membrane protein